VPERKEKRPALYATSPQGTGDTSASRPISVTDLVSSVYSPQLARWDAEPEDDAIDGPTKPTLEHTISDP